MNARLESAKRLYLEGIRDGNAREAVEKYTGDRYTQHSTGVADGVEGFVAFFESFIARTPVRDIQIIRGFEDGRHVFVHVYQDLNHGDAEWVTTDFFDTDEHGKIVEHWDVIGAYCSATPSGHTSIDGPTEVTDLHLTERNKSIVRTMIEQGLMADGDLAQLDEWVAPDCVQHNAAVPDGLEAFKALFTAPDNPLVYDEIVLLVGQGNFVATLCKATRSGDPVAQVDLFRLADGMIAEHWDNAEPALDDGTNSGKF